MDTKPSERPAPSNVDLADIDAGHATSPRTVPAHALNRNQLVRKLTEANAAREHARLVCAQLVEELTRLRAELDALKAAAPR